MKMLCKYIYLMEHIQTIQKVNGLLYYAKMIPWLGKKIPDHWYHSAHIKTIVSIFMMLVTLLMSFALKVGYVLVVLILPLSLLEQTQSNMGVYSIWLFMILSGFGGPLLTSATTQPAKKEYVMISLMHMNAKRYTIARWIWELGMDTLMLSIVFLFVMKYYHMPLWYVGILMLYFVGMHLGGEALHTRYYQTHEKALASCYPFIFGGVIIIFGFAYGSLFLPMNLSAYTNVLMALLLVMALGACLISIPMLRKVDYTAILRKGLLSNRAIYDGTLMTQSRHADIELKDKDYDVEEFKQQVFSSKHGYEYLNALFFQRHKRLFYRPMRRRIIGIIGAFLLFDAALLYFGKELIIGDWNQPFLLLPAVLFPMYFTSIGERVTRAMFYNCDSSLLHYGYYRQPNVILQNFKIRLKKIVLMNGLLALLMVLGYGSVLLLVWNETFVLWEHLLFVACIFGISIFFSIHHLFLYYILQPYTGELEMKSPMFAIINSIVYMGCYFSTRIDGTVIFAYVILAVTILYSVVAMMLVYRLAPKNFHIR